MTNSGVATAAYNILAATPTFSPAGGNYLPAQTVAISTTTAGVAIRYTTDGGTPSDTVGTVYGGPVTVSATTTLKAIAYASGLTNSGVATAVYNILVATPTFSPAGGNYAAMQTVALSTTTAGAAIRYTTDGSTPSDTIGTLYSGPVTVSATTTLKAVAYASGLTNSGVATAVYNNTLVPNVVTMRVDDKRTLQALSAAGQPATGLAWTSSDPTVVSLSTEDPPVLTALAAGEGTITAGTATTHVTVLPGALPAGTVLWSNPGDGSGVTKIVPAVPSSGGVADVFAFQADGTVQAITSEGTTAWTANVSQAYQVLPDFQGGLIVEELNSVKGLNGITGLSCPAYKPGETSYLGGLLGVHTDGTAFAHLLNWNSDYTPRPDTVIGIDPATGTQKFSVPIPVLLPQVYGMVIAGDGYAYVAYAYCERSYGSMVNHLGVLRVSGAGVSDNIDILTWNSEIFDTIPLDEVSMITNADQGILLTWRAYTLDGEMAAGAAITTGASASLVNAPQVPGQISAVEPVLQAQDGSFVGTAYVGDSWTPYMVAFDETGNVHWSVPNEEPQIATADGGVIGQSGITYDQNGNATGQRDLPIQSWTGNSYQVGPAAQVVSDFINIAIGFWPFQKANRSGNWRV